jgi:hypothetical protein
MKRLGTLLLLFSCLFSVSCCPTVPNSNIKSTTNSSKTSNNPPLLDEAKAKAAIETYYDNYTLDGGVKETDFEIGAIFPEDKKATVPYTYKYRDSRDGSIQTTDGNAIFQLAQNGKWYLTFMASGGMMEKSNIEVK